MTEHTKVESTPGHHEPGSACPDRETLTQLLSETLLIESPINLHVESCARCQKRLDELSDSGLLAEYRPWIHNRTPTLPMLEPPQQAGELGRLGELAIESELGRGGMGVVFRGRDLRLGRTVAVKFVRPGSSSETEQRFAREARAVAALQHPNIVPIYQVGQNKAGQDFIVFPLIQGSTLKARLQTNEMEPKQAALIIRQIADALATAHAAGLVHRDVKPSNILLDEVDQQAKIMDFGLVRQDSDNTLTQADMLCGTPGYVSPEQATSGDKVDRRSDIYSLGVTLYECLTGTTPFRGRPLEVIDQHRFTAPTPPQRLNRLVPSDLATICLKAMRKEPDRRYQSMEEMRDDLQRFLAGTSILARPATWQQTFQLWCRREPRLAAALATIAVTMAAGVGFSWYYWSHSLAQSRLAASRFDASLQTINTLADLTSQSLSGDPGLASIRQQVQKMADKAFEPLVELRPTDPDTLVRYLQAMDRLGAIKHTVASPADAWAFRQRIIDENRELVEQYGQVDSLRREWASLHHRLAVCAVEMRDFPKATELLDEASELLSVDDIADQLLLARVKHSRGTIHKWVNNDNARAAPEFREAVELAKLYATTFPADPSAMATANNSQGWLADCEMQLGNLSLAEELLREVYDHYSKLANLPEATYQSRLDQGRAAFTLMSLFVTRGDGEQALRWSDQVGPAIRSLQSSNPTLMEPTALSIGFDGHVASAKLLQGDFTGAKSDSERTLAEAAALELRFPNTTRAWQVHGQARQLWIATADHAAEHANLIDFLEDWLAQIDEEIVQQKNVGFNQQLQLELLRNLALAWDSHGKPEQASPIWAKVVSLAPESQRPGYALLSQVVPYRIALNNGDEPLEPALHGTLEEALASIEVSLNQGARFPNTQHRLAEVHALAIQILQQRLKQNQPGSNATHRDTDTEALVRIEQYQQTVRRLLQDAATAGFYRVGDRWENFRQDPLFADELYQSVLHVGLPK
jgi:serine/threonine protein kinase